MEIVVGVLGGFPSLQQFVAPLRHVWAAAGVGGRISTYMLTCSSDPVDGWTDRWVESKHKSDFGKFVLSAGKFYGDLDKDKGKSLGLGAQDQEDFLEETLVTARVSPRAEQAEEGERLSQYFILSVSRDWGQL